MTLSLNFSTSLNEFLYYTQGFAEMSKYFQFQLTLKVENRKYPEIPQKLSVKVLLENIVLLQD